MDEVIGPLYVSLARYDEVERLLDRPPHSPRYAVSRRALRSVVDAARGDTDQAREGRQVVRDAIAGVDQELLMAFCHQRCGLSAYYTGDYQEAIEWELSAAQMLRRIGAQRGAAAAFSVLYAIHYAVTGDTEAAYEFSRLQVESARACGNASIEIAGIVAQYELAAELADEENLRALRAIIRRRSLPQQYRERFANGIADALPHAWNGDFAALRANVAVLQEIYSRTMQEGALCYALRALADACLGDISAARRHSRSALAATGLMVGGAMPVHEVRYICLARAVAAAACILIGDSVRGRRVFESQVMRFDLGVVGIREVVDGKAWTQAPGRVRGFARAVQVARELVFSREGAISPLTLTETRVLQFLADGLSAPRIAEELDRSVSTIRVHTKSIIAKFNVHGRVAAINHARRFGYIP